ncbi:DNA-methyltransferase [Chengkuizengella sp. SCS-71B]|uniref:DNA-methyltransferase n=1 Tax=Chengkuizengella sp. SCS-71B TaxID=3115290 RepID=UPI0032C225F2
MVLCDLPYGTTQNKWDSIIDLELMWKQYLRIIKDNGAIILTAQTPFDKVLGMSNLKMLKYEWIWQKDAGTGFLNAKKMPLKDHENILVFYKKSPTYNPQMTEGKSYIVKKSHHGSNYGKDSVDEVVTKNEGFRYPKTVQKFSRDKSKYHPTQKPISLFEYLIKTYTNENDVVLDNCIGSGTTAIACLKTNRKFIGFEMEPKYVEIANQRLENVYDEIAEAKLTTGNKDR